MASTEPSARSPAAGGRSRYDRRGQAGRGEHLLPSGRRPVGRVRLSVRAPLWLTRNRRTTTSLGRDDECAARAHTRATGEGGRFGVSGGHLMARWTPHGTVDTSWHGGHLMARWTPHGKEATMSDQTYVYVVTYSKLGAEEGAFYRETAFETIFDAQALAFECMEAYGGRANYTERNRSDRGPHVVTSWDSVPGTTDLARAAGPRPRGEGFGVRTGRRRPVRKPKGKEGFCWAWKNGHKARGVAAQKRKDWGSARGTAKTLRWPSRPKHGPATLARNGRRRRTYAFSRNIRPSTGLRAVPPHPALRVDHGPGRQGGRSTTSRIVLLGPRLWRDQDREVTHFPDPLGGAIRTGRIFFAVRISPSLSNRPRARVSPKTPTRKRLGRSESAGGGSAPTWTPALVLDASDTGRWRAARCSDTARGADAGAARRTGPARWTTAGRIDAGGRRSAPSPTRRRGLARRAARPRSRRSIS